MGGVVSAIFGGGGDDGSSAAFAAQQQQNAEEKSRLDKESKALEAQSRDRAAGEAAARRARRQGGARSLMSQQSLSGTDQQSTLGPMA